MIKDHLDYLMYDWAVEMAGVWDDRGDLDGYCYWWAWRIEERWDEEERTAYEAWKYNQMREKIKESASTSRPIVQRGHRWVSPSKKRKR